MSPHDAGRLCRPVSRALKPIPNESRSIVNQELARKILDAIDEFPEAHNQDNWLNTPGWAPLAPEAAPECGTTMCVAGWAAHLTGWTLDAVTDTAKRGAEVEEIKKVGVRELGLSREDALRLFYVTNARARAALEQIAGGVESIDWDDTPEDDD